MRPSPRLPMAALVAALLCACGGGGGSDPDAFGTTPPFDPAPGVDFDVRAAWSNFLTTGRTWEVSGIGSDGNNYTVTIATAGAGSAIFPVTGEAGTASDAGISIAGAGFIRNTIQRTFFDPASLQITGLVSQEDGGFVTCDVALAAEAPPTAARIPSSGLLALFDQRGDCGPPGLPSLGPTLELRWSLDHEAGVDLFCIHSRLRDFDASIGFVEVDCVEVSPDGTLGDDALVSFEIVNQFVLEARSF